MSLPVGTWKINVNGTEGSLVIPAAPDSRGNFSGRLLGTECAGFWDETSQMITITHRPHGVGAGNAIAVFKGCLFRSPPNPEPGQDAIATLAGNLQVTDGGGFDAAVSTSRRNIFGWVGIITEVN